MNENTTTEVRNKPDFGTLEVLARMTGTEIQAKELVDKWILLTYDIPRSEKGDKARADFLKQAKEIGAAMFTESVYLMPWSPQAELMALQVARVGNACVWTAGATDLSQAVDITRKYDSEIRPQLKEIEVRLDKIAFSIEEGHQKRAERMIEKTEKMIGNLKGALIRRGSAELYITLQILEQDSMDSSAEYKIQFFKDGDYVGYTEAHHVGYTEAHPPKTHVGIMVKAKTWEVQWLCCQGTYGILITAYRQRVRLITDSELVILRMKGVIK